MKVATCNDCLYCAPVYSNIPDKKGNVIIETYFCDNGAKKCKINAHDMICEHYESLEL